MISNARLRLIVLGVAGAETLFWLYTGYYVSGHANPQGDGMEMLAMVPMTIIFLALVVPALILGVLGGWFALASKIAAGFAVVGLIANAIIWTEILAELAGKTMH